MTSLGRYVLESMAAVAAACDAMTHYTERVRGDATGHNLLGILLERQSLRSAAVASFRSALTLMTSQADERKRPIARNLARVMRDVTEACALMSEFKSSSFDEMCAEGFTLATHHLYDEAIAVYETALTHAPPDLASHVLAAMGVLRWASDAREAQRLGRNVDVNPAKGILFKW